MIKRCPSRELAPAGDQVCSPARQWIAGQIGWSMEGKNGPDRLERGDGDATGTVPFAFERMITIP